MPHYYINSQGGYEVHDTPSADPTLTQVPERPTHEHRWDPEAGESGEWALETEADRKRAMGRIPTREFLERVFEPPSDGSKPNNVWERFDEVTRVVPALTQKLAGEYVRGTRAEIAGLGQWLMAHDESRELVAEPGVGSLITPQEYEALLTLLDEYGVQ